MMDPFEFRDEAVQPARNTSAIVWNILTVIVILIALCIAGVFAIVLINPQVSYNPFPPPTLPALVAFPSATPLPRIVLPPTWTPTVSPVPTVTNTPLPSPTATLESAPVTPNDTTTPGEGMPFVLHENDPVAIPNIGHPELGCDWMGVAGRAFNLSDAPITQGLFVQMGGTLNGTPVEMLTMTGVATQYGPGGYEFKLGDKPVASTQTLWVQLFDQANVTLSDKIYFDTFEDCNRNLILIHFDQVR
jgi:hypothetical protein